MVLLMSGLDVRGRVLGCSCCLIYPIMHYGGAKPIVTERSKRKEITFRVQASIIRQEGVHLERRHGLIRKRRVRVMERRLD